MLHNVTPVILAGGSGQRLRPMVSSKRPKPFLKVGSKLSLLQETVKRCADAGMARPVIVCAAGNENRVKFESPEAHVIAEPCARSTAPAIALAADYIGTGHIAVMPSDHYIEDTDMFMAGIMQASNYCGAQIVSLGAEPMRALSCYGYIEYDADKGGAVKRFVEKPAKSLAAEMISCGDVAWNTGIFVCDTAALLSKFAEHAPEILSAVRGDYSTAPNISIDHALMEVVDGSYVLPVKMGWVDVGCWSRFLRIYLRRSMSHV